LKSSFFKISD